MEFSYLYNKANTFCFAILMMLDLDDSVMSCLSEITCAAECLNRNCTGFGFNKTTNQFYIHIGEHHIANTENVVWRKYDSKLEMLDDVAKEDGIQRSAFFKKEEEPLYRFDCSDNDGTISPEKVYTIYPNPSNPYDVQCVVIENKAWTIIQKRQDGSQDFYLNWTDYKHGFGNKHSEYWIGNEALYLLTSKASYQLLIQLEDFENETRYALYDTFAVANESSLYKITISGYSGNAGDSMGYHNGQAFSTKDKDNDKDFSGSCSKAYQGAWWFNACMWSNLNGRYLGGVHTTYGDGVNWATWRGLKYSYKVCRMLIRRK